MRQSSRRASRLGASAGARAAAVLAILLACVPRLAAGPGRPPAQPRDFDDLARCRFIIEEVCARLVAGERQEASAFLISRDRDFGDLPDDLGAIRSCRRKGASDMALLLVYESGSTQEVGLRFEVLAGRTCGFIAALRPAPSRSSKDGKAKGVSHPVLRLKPEKDEQASPRQAYLSKVLEQIRAQRARQEEEADPLRRPLIQKEP